MLSHSLSRPCRRQRAFTLIELLVVILVIAVLIAVAAPSFLGQQAKAQDSAVKQGLTVAYKAAKADAVDNSPQGSYQAGARLRKVIADSEPQMAGAIAVTDTPDAGAYGVCSTSDNENLRVVGKSQSRTSFLLRARANGLHEVVKGECAAVDPCAITEADPDADLRCDVAAVYHDARTLFAQYLTFDGYSNYTLENIDARVMVVPMHDRLEITASGNNGDYKLVYQAHADAERPDEGELTATCAGNGCLAPTFEVAAYDGPRAATITERDAYDVASLVSVATAFDECGRDAVPSKEAVPEEYWEFLGEFDFFGCAYAGSWPGIYTDNAKLGSSMGQVNVNPGGGDSYTASMMSRTGTSFTLQRFGDTVLRSCDATADRGLCRGGTWSS